MHIKLMIKVFAPFLFDTVILSLSIPLKIRDPYSRLAPRKDATEETSSFTSSLLLWQLEPPVCTTSSSPFPPPFRVIPHVLN